MSKKAKPEYIIEWNTGMRWSATGGRVHWLESNAVKQMEELKKQRPKTEFRVVERKPHPFW